MFQRKTLVLGGRLIDLSRPQVMAIVNVTPDSFYGGSRTQTATEIRRRVEQAVGEGASILDVGGYSSRPGADNISPEEEFSRLAAGLEIIRNTAPEIAVSIDTFRAEVASRVIERFGECIVNDISAGELDPEMLPTVAGLRVPYIAMHMRGNPLTMQSLTNYDGSVSEAVFQYFSHKIDELNRHGINDVILDPGFGFSKTVEQNYELLAHMSEFSELGFPLLAGLSRKSMIWRVLECTPDDALNATTALNWEALRQGASILRVHDVKEAVETVKIFEKFSQNI